MNNQYYIRIGADCSIVQEIQDSHDGDVVQIEIKRLSDGYVWDFVTLAFVASAALGSMAYFTGISWTASFTPPGLGNYVITITYNDQTYTQNLEAVGVPEPSTLTSGAITTLANVKAALGLTDTSKDALITLLIPQVEKDFLTIRNKPLDSIVKGERLGIGNGTTVAFTLAKAPIIKDSETIYVGRYSTGDYTVNVTTGVVTLGVAPEAGDPVDADYEAQSAYYPDGSEAIAIQMIAYRIAMQGHSGEKSESLGDHSVTFEKENMLGGYPRSITGAIKRYASFV